MLPLRSAPLLLVLALVGCRRPAPDTSGDDSDPVVDTDPADETDTVDETDVDSDPPDTVAIVLVLTDDQRADTLWAMPEVRDRLATPGVVFEQAFATVPMCCPSRAGFLSGGWHATATHVLTNEPPNGGAEAFVDGDRDTLATRLQAAGYRTGFIGKYLNGFDGSWPYVPPGWDSFATISETTTWTDYTWLEGSSTPTAAGVGTTRPDTEYLTFAQTDLAVAFVREHADESFFLMVNAPAPHEPSDPAPGADYLFTEFTLTAPAFDEEDVTDKPRWVQMLPRFEAGQVAEIQQRARKQLNSLQPVDAMVAAIDDELQAQGIADRTLFVFASDNGYAWGEHRFTGKGAVYDESVMVPLVVRAPGATPGRVSALTAVNLDIPATILDWAAVDAPTGGRSLRPLLDAADAPWRESLVLESYTEGEVPLWAAVVTGRWKYVEAGTGEVELYDRSTDPFELENLVAAPPAEADVAGLQGLLDAERGMVVVNQGPVLLTLGETFSFPIRVRGGTAPLTFSLASGDLPPGVTLDSERGVFLGRPPVAGTWPVDIRVEDASVTPRDGGPLAFTAYYFLEVSAPAALAPAPPPPRRGTTRFEVGGARRVRALVASDGDLTWGRQWTAAVDVAGGVADLELPPGEEDLYLRLEVDGVLRTRIHRVKR